MYKCTSGWDAQRYIDPRFGLHFWLFSVERVLPCKGCNDICPTQWDSTVSVSGTVIVTFVTPCPVAPDALGAA